VIADGQETACRDTRQDDKGEEAAEEFGNSGTVSQVFPSLTSFTWYSGIVAGRQKSSRFVSFQAGFEPTPREWLGCLHCFANLAPPSCWMKEVWSPDSGIT
jgi:hypothetical protein